jgi:adenine/guanine phosphoribosyltransferase-like PRPP-binding protein
VSLKPHEFWQSVDAPGTHRARDEGYTTHYPATFPDGRQLLLPIRVLPDGDHAVASLIVNQASFVVEDALADAMADLLRADEPDVIVGVPTLGLPLAHAVARRLGHDRMVALGTSRKFWYVDDLAEPLSSITTPGQGKAIYLDPRMLPVLADRRIAVVDDVVSSGRSMEAVLRLLGKAGLRPVAIVTAMLQSDRWRGRLGADDAALVRAPLRSPLFARTPAGTWSATDG